MNFQCNAWGSGGCRGGFESRGEIDGVNYIQCGEGTPENPYFVG